MENPNVSNLLLPSVPECNNMTLEGVAELYDHMRKSKFSIALDLP